PRLDLRIHVRQVRQQRLVELLVVTRLDLTLVGGGRRHDDVVTGVARGELAVQLFIAAEIGDRYLDAEFLLEVRNRVIGQIVVPNVEIQNGRLRSICGRLLFLAARRNRDRDRGDDDTNTQLVVHCELLPMRLVDRRQARRRESVTHARKDG